LKQVAQRSGDGRVLVVEVPIPALRNGWVLVSNACSVISAGTERSKLDLGAKNIVQKARARPDLAKAVVRRAQTEGIRSTIAAVRERLDALTPLGYSSAGVVQELGAGVEGLAPGDRVACRGGGWANHAEIVAVPKNLVAKMPPGVSFEDAAYGTVGAIALHAVRQSGAVVGERIGVIGLGLVGQLAVRILSAAGCDVVGVDLDGAAVELAASAGARAFIRHEPRLASSVMEATENLGLDAILICAAGASADAVNLAAQLARDRGRLIVVGDVMVAADRGLLYEKELELRLSRSYGPGRYDREYEEAGRDLPAGYVRWTEHRNLDAFLHLIASGRVTPSELTTNRFPLERAAEAYAVLTERDREKRAFGVVIEYDRGPLSSSGVPTQRDRQRVGSQRRGQARLGLVGAGSFARRVLMPTLQSLGAELVAVASEHGLSATDAASRFGFERASSVEAIFEADDIDAVVIATRHSSHASLAAHALKMGKAVFVEKPLALNWDQLRDVEDSLTSSSLVAVGFNRRFAPLTVEMRDALSGTSQNLLIARVNAGPLPRDHWLNDPEEGGGRLIGEGCHFVDLLTFLAGAPASTVQARSIADPDLAPELRQSFSATLECANGALATIVYAGNGDVGLPKERIEAYAAGIATVIDDFRQLDVYEGGKRRTSKGRGDKGHRAQIDHFLKVLKGLDEPPPVETYLASTRATLALADSLRTGRPVDVR
jgi:predicted dehydrogenase/threonine dehydrogenase-like Zn-dependent dehydrogenase